MKRILSILLICTLLSNLAACSINTQRADSQSEANTLPREESNSAQSQSAEPELSSGNILIAYFTVAENSEVDAIASASVTEIDGTAKGFVRALADMIQSETGGDLHSIQTSVAYPADIGDLIEFAADEQEEDIRPELTSQIENLDDYDTIFLGFPNWWYDLPMAMYSFFEEYDFSGKTIIPFCSHNGSRFSNTIETIQGLEPNATVITDGFTVNQSSVQDAAGDIEVWLRDLGY